MSSRILYGKPVADDIKRKLKLQIEKLAEHNVIPSLSVILIGEDPASLVYDNTKHKTFLKFNCKSKIYKFNQEIKEEEIIKLIYNLNNDILVHGILVQLPLPKHINYNNIINAISPDKDVDGLNPYNLGRLLSGNPNFIPCTPNGCLNLLKYYEIPVENKHIVIIGRSNIVGKPLMALLSQKFKIGNATVTICHTGTKNIEKHTILADIIIAAVGQPELINSTMIKDGVHIIDVGVNRVKDKSCKTGYRLVGDIDFEDVIDKVKSITPVPGGVGPLTISMLLYNTVFSAKKII